MVRTAAQMRKDDIAGNGVRTARPCTRCLHALAENGPSRFRPGCIVGVDPELHNLVADSGLVYIRCERCLHASQDCFAVSLSSFVGLSWLMLTQLAPDGDSCGFQGPRGGPGGH